VSVIDEATNTVTRTIPVGSTPYGVAADPAARTVYVANYSGGAGAIVSVINEATNTVTATVPLDSPPSEVAVDPATRTAYVTSPLDGAVWVIQKCACHSPR
jgi:serine/threonine-protein kinase